MEKFGFTASPLPWAVLNAFLLPLMWMWDMAMPTQWQVGVSKCFVACWPYNCCAGGNGGYDELSDGSPSPGLGNRMV